VASAYQPVKWVFDRSYRQKRRAHTWLSSINPSSASRASMSWSRCYLFVPCPLHWTYHFFACHHVPPPPLSSSSPPIPLRPVLAVLIVVSTVSASVSAFTVPLSLPHVPLIFSRMIWWWRRRRRRKREVNNGTLRMLLNHGHLDIFSLYGL
jgi:hypothetical protein